MTWRPPPSTRRGEQWVVVGDVGAPQHDDVGQLEVLVTAGRTVGPEAQLVAGDRAGHAQRRVAVVVTQAHAEAHQLAEGVELLGDELPRRQHGDGLRAMPLEECAEAADDAVERVGPARRAPIDARGRAVGAPSTSPTRPRLRTLAPEHGSRLSMACTSPVESRNTATARSPTTAATPRSGVSPSSGQTTTHLRRDPFLTLVGVTDDTEPSRECRFIGSPGSSDRAPRRG